MAEGLRLGRLSPEGVQFGKALHNRVLQDFLGFGAENCDSFLTASRASVRQKLQATLDCAPLEDFNR